MNNKEFLCEDIVLNSISKNSNKIRKILDFGCGTGRFTKRLFLPKMEVYGCDVDNNLLKKAKKRQKNIKFTYVSPYKKIPYKSNYFDCVTMMGVLEHVSDEKETLVEIYRILKKGGYLYIYGLNKGLFDIFDTGNIKFRFPYLHKVLYKLFYGEKAYRKEFVFKINHGIFGDFTVGKNWHTHYSVDDLNKLLRTKFKLNQHWLYSFTLPILLAIDFVYFSVFKKESKLIIWLARLDQKLKMGRLSYSFVIECQKL